MTGSSSALALAAWLRALDDDALTRCCAPDRCVSPASATCSTSPRRCSTTRPCRRRSCTSIGPPSPLLAAVASLGESRGAADAGAIAGRLGCRLRPRRRRSGARPQRSDRRHRRPGRAVGARHRGAAWLARPRAAVDRRAARHRAPRRPRTGGRGRSGLRGPRRRRPRLRVGDRGRRAHQHARPRTGAAAAARRHRPARLAPHDVGHLGEQRRRAARPARHRRRGGARALGGRRLACHLRGPAVAGAPAGRPLVRRSPTDGWHSCRPSCRSTSVRAPGPAGATGCSTTWAGCTRRAATGCGIAPGRPRDRPSCSASSATRCRRRRGRRCSRTGRTRRRPRSPNCSRPTCARSTCSTTCPLIAPGPLAADVDRRLRELADVESVGVASSYRVTSASVTGRSPPAPPSSSCARSCRGLAHRHPAASRVPAHRDRGRFGSLRVGALDAPVGGPDAGAHSYVRGDDPSLVGQLVIDQSLASLVLRRTGDTARSAASTTRRSTGRSSTRAIRPSSRMRAA